MGIYAKRPNETHQQYRDRVIDKLSPSFCGAKWYNATIWLGNGTTTSCHHPPAHKIPLTELEVNYKALHNTKYKKAIRKQMMEGIRPKECEYCWKIEDLGKDKVSDRVYKSVIYTDEELKEAKETMGYTEDVDLKTLEIAFDGNCNFACSYCNASFSTTWQKDIKVNGPYQNLVSDGAGAFQHDGSHAMPYGRKNKDNPYVEAFWKWWPDLYRDLHTFRITGGEPLLSKDTWGVLDYIINEPNPNRKLNLAINSNLGIQDALLDKFIEKVNKIEDEDRVNEFIIFTSIDGWGEQAEYIRNGLEFNRFWDNMNKVLTKCPKVNLTIMSTFNALSVPSYKKLIDGVYD